jgi:uncharacterized RDD family membrane protein YckC
LLESYFGTTLGGQLLGLKVLRETKMRAGFGNIFLRRLPVLFDFVIFDMLFILFNSKKQGALDSVAKTIVVRERRPHGGGGAGRPAWP